jgi:DNA-binding transcriptional MerR regulator
MSTEEMLNQILDSLDQIDYIQSSTIPDMELYMDQVTSYMDAKLGSAIHRPKESRILTKTMINNYAKNNLLPPPLKKKYTKEHILLLIFIYYFKNVLPIHDIQELLRPITDRYFRNDPKHKLEDIYEEVFCLEKGQIETLKKDIKEKYRISQQSFTDADPEDVTFLQTFTMICLLSFDIYLKKQMIEKLIKDIT